MDFDPYEVLGVPRDATIKKIKDAFKKLAKERHPDKGGDAEEFYKLTLAANILLSVERRAKFDATGDVEDGAKNDRAEAIVHIVNFVDQIMGAYVHAQFSDAHDPRRMDLFKLFREHMAAEIEKSRGLLKQDERVIAFAFRHALAMLEMRNFPEFSGWSPDQKHRHVAETIARYSIHMRATMMEEINSIVRARCGLQ